MFLMFVPFDLFRLCVPGEVVCGSFTETPDPHIFPSPSICKTSAIKISVSSLPRQSDIPRAVCLQAMCMGQIQEALTLTTACQSK